VIDTNLAMSGEAANQHLRRLEEGEKQ